MEKNIDTKQTSYSLNETIAGNDTFDSTSIKKFAPVWEKDDDEQSDMRSFLDIQLTKQALYEKVWYNRHIKTKKAVENGEETVPSEVWDSVLRDAAQIEQKYGAENLIVDDKQFYELQGKLFALTWVLGDDWNYYDIFWK